MALRSCTIGYVSILRKAKDSKNSQVSMNVIQPRIYSAGPETVSISVYIYMFASVRMSPDPSHRCVHLLHLVKIISIRKFSAFMRLSEGSTVIITVDAKMIRGNPDVSKQEFSLCVIWFPCYQAGGKGKLERIFCGKT